MSSAPAGSRAPPLYRVSLRKCRPEQVGELAVKGAGGAHAQRPRRPAHAVDDLSPVDGQRRGERASQLEQDHRGLVQRDRPATGGLVDDRARGRAHLVRRPEVDPVVLAVPRNRRQVDDARTEHDR